MLRYVVLNWSEFIVMIKIFTKNFSKLFLCVLIKHVCELPILISKMEYSKEMKTVSVKQKLNMLTTKRNLEILEAVDKDGKKGQFAKDFKILASALSMM